MNQLVPMQDAPRPKSVMLDMADRFGMEAKAFESTLRATVIPDKITDGQFAAFLLVAKEYNLNPLTKEIYAFPTRAGGIQPVVSIDGWMNLINSHPKFDGMEFEDVFEDDGKKLKAITCRMYRKDRSHPTCVTEYMSECAKATETWKQWPARMLRHKAAIQCARYAFGFSGIIDEDEYDRLHSAQAPAPPPAPRIETMPPAAPPPARQHSPKSSRDGVQRSKAELARDAVAPRDPALRAGFEAQAPAETPYDEDGVVIENGVDAPDGLLVNYGDKIEDWIAQLKQAPADERKGLYYDEIVPRIEAGSIFPPDADRLKAAAGVE